MTLPHVGGQTALLLLVAVFGAVSGIAFVAVGVALASASTPATRGLVMGGAALYLGFALGRLARGPSSLSMGMPRASRGAAVIGTLAAAALWAMSGEPRSNYS
jgi:hypothetical protein